MVLCPVCDAEIDVDEDELEEGDTITCDECGSELRVVSVDPLELEPVEEEDEEEEENLGYEDDEEEEEEEEDENWK
jgi:alpha-aminoadipate carrier protein LysW